jgi:peptidoglycan/xylan/chitin deacetylase (PgdA/CDA1 family)
VGIFASESITQEIEGNSMTWKHWIITTALCMMMAVSSNAADNFPYSQIPPGGLKPAQCPMFVLFAFDDNGNRDGILWFRNLVKDLKNHDNSPVRATFLNTGIYGSNDPAVLAAWKLLYQDGHELGNHSWDHPHGAALSLADWQTQIGNTNNFLVQNIPMSAGQVKGFRTPYLEYSATTMQAVVSKGLQYDCSIEFGYNGWQPDVGDPDYPPATTGVWWNSMQSSRTFKKLFWPYTLDHGSPPGNSAAGNPTVAGLWEVPVYTWLRSDTGAGVVTGFDFNLWITASRATFAATIKMNFDLRYAGNRSPLLISAHTDYYAPGNADAESAFPNAHYPDRQLAIKDILTYVQQFPETRIVPISSMIAWMKNPTPVGVTPVNRKQDLAAGLLGKAYGIQSVSKNRVEFSIPTSGAYTFSILSLQGRTIERHAGFRDAGANASFPIRKALSPGAYIFCLNNESGIVLQKTVEIR